MQKTKTDENIHIKLFEQRHNQERRTVKALCDVIGYGNVMVLANQEWAKVATIPGSELVVGPCRLMLEERGFKCCLELLDAYDELHKQTQVD